RSPPPSDVLTLFYTPPLPSPLYPLSLHDALPIFSTRPSGPPRCPCPHPSGPSSSARLRRTSSATARWSPSSTIRTSPRSCATARSEEHTSELQSLTNLVCRLLLEKKNQQIITPLP